MKKIFFSVLLVFCVLNSSILSFWSIHATDSGVWETLYNFDDLEVGSTPSDFPVLNANSSQFAKVSKERATSGNHSLWICDNYAGPAAFSQTSFTPTDKLTLEFNLFPQTYAQGELLGYSISLASQISTNLGYEYSINQIYFINDGSVIYLNSNAQGISYVFPAGTIKQGDWNRIKVAADANGTTKLFINDSSAVDIGVAFAATTYSVLRFNSSGGTITGDSYLVDDISIKNQYDATAITRTIQRDYRFFDFENYTAGTTVSDFPLKYSENNDYIYAKVSDNRGESSAKSLILFDNAYWVQTTTITKIIPSTQLSLAFDFYPQSYSALDQYAGFVISLASDDGPYSYSNAINQIYVFSDGSIQWHNGNSVITAFPAGTVKLGQWNKIIIAADTVAGTKMSVNESTFADIGKWHYNSNFQYVYLSSSGGSYTGDIFYFDNMLLTNSAQDAKALLNKKPVAKNISLSCAKNANVSGTFDATDAEGDALTYSLTKQPSNGSITVNGNSFTYTPNSNYIGRDLIWYVAKDGNGTSNTGAIEVTVQGQTSQSIVNEGRFIIDSSNGEERQFPFLFKFGNHIFASYAQREDASIVSPIDGLKVSHDNGLTWNTKITNNDFYFTSMFEKDGLIYGVNYGTYLKTNESRPYGEMIYWTTADYGETWAKHTGRVNPPDGFNFHQLGVTGSLLFHRGMMIMEDGSLQGTMYGQWTDITSGAVKSGVVWVKSTDNCATWNIVSIITDATAEGKFTYFDNFCEPNVARVKDGSLLCVMRTGSYAPLYMSRSTDNGLTWSKPTTLPGLSREQAYSIDPQLLLMDNGVLAMAYGRSGALLAFSSDGSGYNWDTYYEVYQGFSNWTKNATGGPYCEGMCGIVETEPGRLLYVGDQGRTGSPNPSIWGTFLNINIAPKSYSDVAEDIPFGKLTGVSAISGSAGITSATGISSLLDEDPSTLYIPDIGEGTHSTSSVPSHSITLDLGKTMNLNSVVVRHEFSSIWKYKIEISENNITWSTFADKTSNSSVVQNSCDNGNVSARYVKYTITGNQLVSCYNTDCNIAIHNYISIRGIELYGENPFLFGDINTDNTVDISDLILLRNHLVGKSELSSDKYKYADFNTDNTLDIIDILELKSKILNK